MIRNIITGREEDASLFLHCLCGKEIIQIYYYKEDNILQKIIGLRFYGNIEKNSNLSYMHFQFTENLFFNFISKLEEFIKFKCAGNVYMNHCEDILHLGRDVEGFYIISRSKDIDNAKKGKYIWDIVFRDSEAEELLNGLKEIKSQILNDNKNNSLPNDIKQKQLPSTFIKDIS